MSINWLVTRRSAFKAGLGMLIGIGCAAASYALHPNQQIKKIDNPRRKFSVKGNISLKQRAATKGLIYGAAIQHSQLSSDIELQTYVKRQCGIILPELELKSNVLRPTPTSFNFVPADGLANFARTNGLLFRGHTLVWHEALPPWFKDIVNSQNAGEYLEQHIKTVVQHYAGQIHSWDVVNEAIHLSDNQPDGLRATPWLELLGPDYIELAFRFAAEYDPNALLVYNEYGLDYDTSASDAKRTAVLNLLAGLKSKGTPIHALGIQAHLSGHETRFNPEKLRHFLTQVANLGLKIMITEMDVTDKKLPVDIKVRDRIVAAAYEDYLSAALDEKAVIAVLTWGLSDRYTWLTEFKPRPDRKPVRPLPLDARMQRKLAWNAIARAFDHAPKR